MRRDIGLKHNNMINMFKRMGKNEGRELCAVNVSLSSVNQAGQLIEYWQMASDIFGIWSWATQGKRPLPTQRVVVNWSIRDPCAQFYVVRYNLRMRSKPGGETCLLQEWQQLIRHFVFFIYSALYSGLCCKTLYAVKRHVNVIQKQ